MIQGVRRKSATTEMTLSCGLIFFLRIKDRKDRAGSEVRHRRKMTRGRDKSGRLSTESGELGRGRRQAHSVLERTRFGRVCRWVLEDERTGGMSSCQQSGAGGGGRQGLGWTWSVGGLSLEADGESMATCKATQAASCSSLSSARGGARSAKTGGESRERSGRGQAR